MNLDEIDIKLLKENFDEEVIKEIDPTNAYKIYKYLEDNGVYYAKDLYINHLDLFLSDYEDFVKRFERLKKEVGSDFVDKLGEDDSLIEIMYKD